MTETVQRPEPPMLGDERAVLIGFLDFHRATLEMKCAGLTPAQLATTGTNSELSLLGLVRHVTEVERSWFRSWGELEAPEGLYYTDEDPDGDFHVGDPQDADDALVEQAFAAWREAVAYSRDVVTTTKDLGAVSRDHRTRPVTLRWIVVHMIEEYARHNGHADLLREALDGATGE